MMNVLDIQDKLKSLSQDQLTKEMQMPSGAVPQFLVLGELNRRQTMRQSMQQQGAGSQTVAQEILNGAGVPAEGMSDMAGSMAPKSSIAQNTGIGALPQAAPPEQGGGIAALAPQDQQPVGMFGGGPVRKMYEGSNGPVSQLPSWLTGDIFGRETVPYDEARKAPDGPDSHRVVDGESLRLIEEAKKASASGDQPWWARSVFADAPPVPQRSGPTPLSVFNQQEEQRKAAAAQLASDEQKKKDAASGGGSGAGSGAGGAGPMSSYEKMLQDAMANAEKKAKQDKWLALAQAGMALMSSTSGSFAGALGEAGKVGIEALQGSRDVAEQNKLKLGQEMFGIEQARAAQARAAAASGRKRELTSSDLMAQLDKVQKFIDTIDPPPDGITDPIPLGPAEQASVDEAKAYRDSLIQEISRMGIGAADLADPAQ